MKFAFSHDKHLYSYGKTARSHDGMILWRGKKRWTCHRMTFPYHGTAATRGAAIKARGGLIRRRAPVFLSRGAAFFSYEKMVLSDGKAIFRDEKSDFSQHSLTTKHHEMNPRRGIPLKQLNDIPA